MENSWTKEDGTFIKLKSEELEKLEADDLAKYQDALSADNLKRDEELAGKIVGLEKKEGDHAEEIKEMKAKLDGIKIEDMQTMMKALRELSKDQRKRRESGESTGSSLESAMKSAFDKQLTSLKGFNDNKNKAVKMVIKAEQTYGDISDGEDYAQFKPGITDKPVRMPKIRQLFSSLPIRGEFLKYAEQDTVVRDAQNVAKCAAVTSNTKETIVVNEITTKVIKDQIDFCRLFVADYPFMRSRIDRLINQSLALRIDYQYLLGDGTGENVAGIDSYASDFNAANVACDISASVQAATYVDLILGMETQIVELGQQNAYVPDTVIVNKCDWFIYVQSRKDLNNNYLDTRVTMVNGVPQVGGMSVVWTPICPQNELYVQDSTKGESLDRQEVEVEVAFENDTNWEREIASLKALARLNLLVENNNANAFMHAPDVAAAITAITAP